MQPFIRGQRAKISAFSPAQKFEVTIELNSARIPVFDFVCFGVDANALLSDDRFMVFFNQKSAPNEAIRLLELHEQNAQFAVDLDQIPPSVVRLVFTSSVDGAGAMRDLTSGLFSLREAKAGSAALLEYRFEGGDFQNEGALMIAELYRKDGQWRVWAQGQGFAGDLSALLKHFGGQEIEDNMAPPVAASPGSGNAFLPSVAAPPGSRSASSLPVRAPLVPPPIPMPLAPSPVASAPVVAGSLQHRVAQTPPGGTLSLSPGEYQGPIVLDKPITLDGNGAAVWAHFGPVVTISSSRVSITNLDIEATAPDALVADSGVALRVEAGTHPHLESVKTRGEVLGVAGLEGAWHLPLALDLGEFAPRALNSFILRVEVPGACELKTPVAGVSFHPARLGRGPGEVEVRVENVGPDTFLAGVVEFGGGQIARTVPLSGRAAKTAVQAVRGRILNAN